MGEGTGMSPGAPQGEQMSTRAMLGGQPTQAPTTLRAEVDILQQQVNRLFDLLTHANASANDRIDVEEGGFEEISRRLGALEHEVGLDVPRAAHMMGRL